MEVYVISLKGLEQEELQKILFHQLSTSDQVYLEKWKSPKKRLTILGGRLLLRHVARLHGLTSYHLEYGENGKPFFSNSSDHFFNISHSGEYLSLAWSSKDIGIDLEQIRKEMPKFPERMLSATDFSYFQKQREDQKKACFFTLWTRKESFIKLYGNNIFQKAREISVTDGTNLLSVVNDPFAYFHTCQWKDYIISVCTLEKWAHLSVQYVTLQEIIP